MHNNKDWWLRRGRRRRRRGGGEGSISGWVRERGNQFSFLLLLLLPLGRRRRTHPVFAQCADIYRSPLSSSDGGRYCSYASEVGVRNIQPRSHASVLSKKTQFTFRKRRRKRWERKVGGSDFSSLFHPLHGDGRGGKRRAVLLFGKVRSAKKEKKRKSGREVPPLFFSQRVREPRVH